MSTSRNFRENNQKIQKHMLIVGLFIEQSRHWLKGTVHKAPLAHFNKRRLGHTKKERTKMWQVITFGWAEIFFFLSSDFSLVPEYFLRCTWYHSTRTRTPLPILWGQCLQATAEGTLVFGEIILRVMDNKGEGSYHSAALHNTSLWRWDERTEARTELLWEHLTEEGCCLGTAVHILLWQ